jgi:hypothetical protein
MIFLLWCKQSLFIEHAIEWKRRLSYRAHRQRQQRYFVIVPGDSILFQSAAGDATVDDDPLLAPPDGNSNRLHDTPARGSAVARLFVQVYAPQAPRAMVAVHRPRGGRIHVTPAMSAGELPGFIFTIDFREFFIHENSPQLNRFVKKTKNRGLSHTRSE